MQALLYELHYSKNVMYKQTILQLPRHRCSQYKQQLTKSNILCTWLIDKIEPYSQGCRRAGAWRWHCPPDLSKGGQRRRKCFFRNSII